MHHFAFDYDQPPEYCEEDLEEAFDEEEVMEAYYEKKYSLNQ